MELEELMEPCYPEALWAPPGGADYPGPEWNPAVPLDPAPDWVDAYEF